MLIMSISGIQVERTIEEVKKRLESDRSLSPTLVNSINLLILLVQILIQRLQLNSSNSSLPPSQDGMRKKHRRFHLKRRKSDKKAGGQEGHEGETLEQVEDPDEIVDLEIDRRTLPNRTDFKSKGYEARQVIDFSIECFVREYRAEVLEDCDGNRYVATFPENVTKAIQYGSSVKSLAVYLSQYQLVPYNRVQEVFRDQFGLEISQGSLYNFNREAYEKLEDFEKEAVETLKKASVLNADETGIQIGETNHWLHVLSTPKTTYFFPHEKRGKEAMEEMAVLKDFKGVLCHDHWKPYFGMTSQHALCNAHHLRELQWVIDFKNQHWAMAMKRFLVKTNEMVIAHGGVLPEKDQRSRIQRYRSILQDGKKECPLIVKTKGQKGRPKQTKERNLLDRLIEFESNVLLFMKIKNVPFTNNQAERDIRMVKVHQKVSGCFRSLNGARHFCRTRSYLLTHNKRGQSPFSMLCKVFEPQLAE
jgi:transposase